MCFAAVRSFRMISGEDSAKMKSLVLVSVVRFANIFIMKELFLQQMLNKKKETHTARCATSTVLDNLL